MENIQGEERSCPAMDESRSCTVASCYHWSASPRGRCELPFSVGPSEPCGAGTRLQRVTCLRWDGTEVADKTLCNGTPRPRDRVECAVPCPNDCIVSDWSGWSDCPSLSCKNLQIHPRIPLRHRNRTIVAIAGRDGQVFTEKLKAVIVRQADIILNI